MWKSVVPIVFCLLPVVVSGWLNNFGWKKEQDPEPDWNDLKVTWTENLKDPFRFAHLPLTELEASFAGFKKISGCENSTFLGSRYVKDNDYTVIIIYNSYGNIAGIQTGIPRDTATGFPSPKAQPPFIQDGDLFYLTMYFSHPATICRWSRTFDMVKKHGVGTNLYLQTGRDRTQINSFTLIPKEESAVQGTSWTGGMCFPTMGVHYWYNILADMRCEDFYPLFLLFNGGKLNGFGWAFLGNYTSPRLETPRQEILPVFLNPVPNCLFQQPEMRTMHIFLTKAPEENYC